ncbi:MAG TPA: phosphoribosylanthranilate isomerase [Chthonomonadales bacterium]|nr:phosphoribosylanthranilate isomerase [Chthonomonadales bacterium]
MTRVKVCGVTSRHDADAAVELGADALGFILVPESPRYVGERSDLPDLLASLPPFVARVAVSRRARLPDAIAAELDAVQFYDGSASEARTAGKRILRVVRLRGPESIEEAEKAATDADALVLDAYSPHALGGAGVPVDRALASAIRSSVGCPVVLAGGLDPEKVAEAIRAVRPYAVDVSSGVESAPGVKDRGKLRAFIEAVRSADAEER